MSQVTSCHFTARLSRERSSFKTNKYYTMWSTLVMLGAAVAVVAGHGRLLTPPGRGTLWRVGYNNTEQDFTDNELNCGGFARQHTVNGGKCGICGDPYDEQSPRKHERGGVYDSGIITGKYEAGSVITVTIEITAHHMGYWELKICPDANRTDQACFDKYPVELDTGDMKYYPEQGASIYEVKYKLPKGLSCERCVLQWRWICGNNWGTCKDGSSGVGCGDQEFFYGCADISIKGKSRAPPARNLIPAFGKPGKS